MLVSGIGTGSIYGLVGLGFAVIHRSTGAINFAQGEWVMLAGMLAAAMVGLAVPVWAACALAVLLTTAVGALSELLMLRPVRRPSPLLTTLITIGMAILTKGVVMVTLGKNPAGYPGFLGDAVVRAGGVAVPSQTVFVLLACALFVACAHVAFQHTRTGKAMRATASDRDAAALVGIPVRRTITLSFALAAAAGAVAGVVVTPLTFTSYEHGAMLGFKGFSAAMLGGLGNPFGAVAGGVLLGVLEAAFGFAVSSRFKDALAFVVLLLVLFARPGGLFGARAVERV